MTPTDVSEVAETAELRPEETMADGNLGIEHEHTHTHEASQPTLNPELMREIEVSVDAETVSKAFRGVVKKYQRLARIPGFRIGKVPESVIKHRFSKDVRQEVLDELVTARFRSAIEEQKLNPVSQPQLTNLMLVDGQPLQFKAAFEVLPEIAITGYDSVEVEKPEVGLTDAEYEGELARLMDSHGTVEPVEEERELLDGDWAEINFTGKIQDLAQTVGKDGLEKTSTAQPIKGEDVLIEVGGKNTLPAFNEALRGTRVGQEMQFEVSYPSDFGEPKLAGQTVQYDVEVKAIKRKTYPEKDTELARQMGDYESWEGFEQKLRERTAARKREALQSGAKEKMLEELIRRYDFPVPESFVQQQIDSRLDRGLRALAQQGMSADDMRKLDFNRLRTAQRDQAINEVKASLILDRIAEAENVIVSEDEVERELMILSIQAREPFEATREKMQKDGGLDRMREQMRREKTGTALCEKLAK